MTNRLDPVHPGEVLLEEFIRPLGLSQYRLAKGMNVPARRINEIVKRERSVTADTALRLARFFGTTEMFWLNLQARYDLDVEKDRLGDRLLREVGRFAAPVAARQVSLRRIAASRTGTFSRRMASKKR